MTWSRRPASSRAPRRTDSSARVRRKRSLVEFQLILFGGRGLRGFIDALNRTPRLGHRRKESFRGNEPSLAFVSIFLLSAGAEIPRREREEVKGFRKITPIRADKKTLFIRFTESPHCCRLLQMMPERSRYHGVSSSRSDRALPLYLRCYFNCISTRVGLIKAIQCSLDMKYCSLSLFLWKPRGIIVPLVVLKADEI